MVLINIGEDGSKCEYDGTFSFVGKIKLKNERRVREWKIKADFDGIQFVSKFHHLFFFCC
jgi:hypothetical protein